MVSRLDYKQAPIAYTSELDRVWYNGALGPIKRTTRVKWRYLGSSPWWTGSTESPGYCGVRFALSAPLYLVQTRGKTRAASWFLIWTFSGQTKAAIQKLWERRNERGLKMCLWWINLFKQIRNGGSVSGVLLAKLSDITIWQWRINILSYCLAQ